MLANHFVYECVRSIAILVNAGYFDAACLVASGIRMFETVEE